MWKTVKLGDVCQIVNGGTPKSKVPDYWNGDIDWLTPKDMGKLPSRYINNTERAITQDGLENSSAKLIPSGSVLLSCRAPIGHTGINPKPISFNQGCKGLIPDNEVIAEYLYYFLFASKKLLNDLGSGTTFKEISSKTLSQVPIPLPPLGEQKRIVERLDKAFAEIDKAIATAEAKEGEVERLKAATLSAMLNRGYHSGGSVIEVKADSVMWETVRLGEVCELAYGKALAKSERLEFGEIPAFGANGIKTYSKNALFSEPSIIVGRKGSAGQITKVTQPFWALDVTYYTKTDASRIDLDFLYYTLSILDLPSMARGVKPGINRNDLYGLDISLPPLVEQKRIVERLDKAFGEVEIISDKTQSSVENYNALKAAILQQELAPSDAA